MNDDSVRAHLKAALDAVTRREEARVQAIYDEADGSLAQQIAAMRPVVALLSALQQELGVRDDVRFTLPDRAHLATVETGSAASSHRIRLSFDTGLKSYRVERTDTYLFADGGTDERVIHAPSPDEAVKHVVELLGEHLGAERALQIRRQSV